MKKIIGKSPLLKKNIELLVPLNTIVFPNLIFTSRLTIPQKELIQKIQTDQVLTTFLHSSQMLEKQYEVIRDYIESAQKQFMDFKEQNINKEVPPKFSRKKNAFNDVGQEIIKSKEYYTFDPEFRRLINKNYFDSQSEYDANNTSLEEYDRIFSSQQTIYGSLNKINFHEFEYKQKFTPMVHLFGQRIVKFHQIEELDENDLKNWLLQKIFQKTSENEKKLENLQKNISANVEKRKALEIDLDKLRNQIDENHSEYIFQHLHLLQQDLYKKKFKFVSYENTESINDQIFNLNQDEFTEVKRLAIEINSLLKTLLIQTNFILYYNFYDINQYAMEQYFLHWYNNLIGILYAKKVINDASIQYLSQQTSILEQMYFLHGIFKNFQIQYLSKWKEFGSSNKPMIENDNEKDQQVKEIYEQFKKMEEQSFSPTKRELIQNVEKFLNERKLTSKVKQIINEELTRFKELNQHESDYQITKNYLDLICKLPFDVFTSDETSIKKAKKILESSHYGMDDVKKRILEFLAIGKLKENFVSNKVLCLVGPPGVGKTSIAKSIAECLGRKFVRIALGGEDDVSILKGHRRSYLGAYPGKILNALKLAESENPVILLDEIDKIGRNHHKGNVQDVLLEILDPMQNKEFYDHYLEAPIDLSKVLFLCSANILDSSTISSALYDRMEVIELSGYTKFEKYQIFHDYLLNKTMKKVGLDQYNIKIDFPEQVLYQFIDDYARESGVRGLEKKTQVLLEKFVLNLFEKKEEIEKYKKSENEEKQDEMNFSFTMEKIQEFLGPKLFHTTTIIHQKTEDLIGFALGLGYNSIGGSVLSLEVVEIPEKISVEDEDDDSPVGELEMTGQLGNVMKESVLIAYSYAKNFIHSINPENQFLDSKKIHIHFPEGASKKDGPSAGITITSALISLALQKVYNTNFAMTGEISLNGNIMKIGGLKEKILAAKRENVTNVICPLSNKHDVEEMKDNLKEGMTFHFVKNYKEVFDILFTDNQQPNNQSIYYQQQN